MLGSTTVTTNGAGQASFDVVLPAAVEPGWLLTATATLEPVGATSEFSACTEIEPGDVTDVAEGAGAPAAPLRLAQNVPNPFRAQTAITYSLEAGGEVALGIYDVQGRLVRRLIEQPLDAGTYTATWDARDAQGHAVQSGIYFYRLDTPAGSEQRRLTIVR
jgi:methionine-rich copper-binding protein CopC